MAARSASVPSSWLTALTHDQPDPLERAEIQGALRRDLDRPGHPAARHQRLGRTTERRMVDRRRRDHPGAAPPLDDRRQAEHAERVGLGPAAREHDLLARPADQAGDLVAGALDPIPGLAPLGVDRRRVPGKVQGRLDHGLTGRRDERRRRVEVQVDPRIR